VQYGGSDICGLLKVQNSLTSVLDKYLSCNVFRATSNVLRASDTIPRVYSVVDCTDFELQDVRRKSEGCSVPTLVNFLPEFTVSAVQV
jgi:hypothetical protein